MDKAKGFVKLLFIIGLVLGFSKTASADMNFSLIQLGNSSEQTQEILAEKGFLFERITENNFKAVKLALAPKIENPRGDIKEIQPRTEYSEIHSSTSISGKFCAGKLYDLVISSFYQADGGMNIWSGRRQIYEYLESNKAVMEKLNLSKKEGDPNVGFVFNIDRSALGGSVKGVEVVTVMIDASTKSGLKLLEMKYRFSNKWFCPE